MSMSRSDVDNATPRVTRVEALSRVSPGFPPRAITCAGASTVVPLVHSPLVSPLSDSPSCPVPAARPWSGPGSARSGQRLRRPSEGDLHSVARHARQVRIGRGPYRKNTLPTSHFVGHHSRFRSPKLKSLLCKCNILRNRNLGCHASRRFQVTNRWAQPQACFVTWKRPTGFYPRR